MPLVGRRVAGASFDDLVGTIMYLTSVRQVHNRRGLPDVVQGAELTRSKLDLLIQRAANAGSSSPPSSSGRKLLRHGGIWGAVTADATDGRLTLLNCIKAAVGT